MQAVLEIGHSVKNGLFTARIASRERCFFSPWNKALPYQDKYKMFNSASLFRSQDFSFSFSLYLCPLICILKGAWYAGVIRSHQRNKWCHLQVINAKTLIALGQMGPALSELRQMSPAQTLSSSRLGRSINHLPAFVPLGPDFMKKPKQGKRLRLLCWAQNVNLCDTFRCFSEMPPFIKCRIQILSKCASYNV